MSTFPASTTVLPTRSLALKGEKDSLVVGVGTPTPTHFLSRRLRISGEMNLPISDRWPFNPPNQSPLATLAANSPSLRPPKPMLHDHHQVLANPLQSLCPVPLPIPSLHSDTQ